VSSDGFVITNYHVIKGASQIIGLTTNGANYMFERVVFVAPGADSALPKSARGSLEAAYKEWKT
jgi:S1-C subfamily serine protease